MQKLKTRVIKKTLNPEWNDDLTLSISDPHAPVHLVSNSFYNVCISNFNTIPENKTWVQNESCIDRLSEAIMLNTHSTLNNKVI